FFDNFLRRPILLLRIAKNIAKAERGFYSADRSGRRWWRRECNRRRGGSGLRHLDRRWRDWRRWRCRDRSRRYTNRSWLRRHWGRRNWFRRFETNWRLLFERFRAGGSERNRRRSGSFDRSRFGLGQWPCRRRRKRPG